MKDTHPPSQANRPIASIATLLVLAAVAVVIGFVAVRHSANTRVLGDNWDQQGLLAIENFHHDAYRDLLNKYVDDAGRVDYERWHQNPDDMLALQNYLQSTSRVRWNADGTAGTELEQTVDFEKAFWINAYNALTLHALLTLYPTDSVRHHTNPVGLNVWNHHKLMVGSRARSLAEIEQECLSRFEDPRVQFCIVRGSVSCPPLMNESFEASKLENQISGQTTRFLRDENNLRLEGTSRVHLSPVIRTAFPDAADQPESLLPLLSELVPELKISEKFQGDLPKISWLNHDWSLNKK